MDLHDIIAIASEAIALLGVIASVILTISKLIDGQRCLLRSEMLKIYYKHRDEKTIRQYEFENFNMLYQAYKKLKGNSFIDKCKREVDEWKVIS